MQLRRVAMRAANTTNDEADTDLALLEFGGIGTNRAPEPLGPPGPDRPITPVAPVWPFGPTGPGWPAPKQVVTD